MEWELNLIKNIQAYQNSFFDMFFWLISVFASVVGIFIIFFLLFFLYKKIFSFIFLISSLFTILIGYFLKYLINRPRPYQIDFDIVNKTNALGKSYPSGHMIVGTTLVLYVTIFALKKFKKTWQKVLVIMLGFVYLFLLAISRMYFGQHYATDLIAGFVLAYGINLCLYFSICYFLKDKNIKF